MKWNVEVGVQRNAVGTRSSSRSSSLFSSRPLHAFVRFSSRCSFGPFRMRFSSLLLGLALFSHQALAQRGGGRGNPLAAYTRIDTAVIALTHARVIDGTGAAAKADQTLIIRDGMIERIGPSASTPVPAGVQ